MKSHPDRQRVLESLVALSRRFGRPPSRREFLAHSAISEGSILRFFPTWNAALLAAGLPPYTLNRRRADREFLEDWGRVARKNRKIPSRRDYCHLGTFDHRTVSRRFGRWSQVPEAFRKFARRKTQWADVLALLPPPASTHSPNRAPSTNASAEPGKDRPQSRTPFSPWPASSSATSRSLPQRSDSSFPHATVRHPSLRGRPTYGHPIDFRGLRHEPVNEQGVVLIFALVARELGYIVEAVQSGFPDCEAKRQIGPQRWQRVHIEFEFESRNFRDHGHPLTGCDIIVCWRHNWPACPAQIEVLELSTLIRSLPNVAPPFKGGI